MSTDEQPEVDFSDKPQGPRRRNETHEKSHCICKIPEPVWRERGDLGGNHACVRCTHRLNTDTHGFAYRRLPGDLDAFQGTNQEIRDVINGLPEWEKQRLVGLNGKKLVKAVNSAIARQRLSREADKLRGGPPPLGPNARRRLAKKQGATVERNASIAGKLAAAMDDPSIGEMNNTPIGTMLRELSNVIDDIDTGNVSGDAALGRAIEAVERAKLSENASNFSDNKTPEPIAVDDVAAQGVRRDDDDGELGMPTIANPCICDEDWASCPVHGGPQ